MRDPRAPSPPRLPGSAAPPKAASRPPGPPLEPGVDERALRKGDTPTDGEDPPEAPSEDDALDPSTRQLAYVGFGPPPVRAALEARAVAAAAPPPPPPPSLEHLMPAVVRRIAWGGDRRKASVRMELGGGLDGAVVVMHADGGQLRVEVDGPAGEVDGFRERITDRLRRRGLHVSEAR